MVLVSPCGVASFAVPCLHSSAHSTTTHGIYAACMHGVVRGATQGPWVGFKTHSCVVYIDKKVKALLSRASYRNTEHI